MHPETTRRSVSELNRKDIRRAVQEVSKDMLRGHIHEDKKVCPKDRRVCLLTMKKGLTKAFFLKILNSIGNLPAVFNEKKLNSIGNTLYLKVESTKKPGSFAPGFFGNWF